MGNAVSLPIIASLNPDNASQVFATLDRRRQGFLTLKELMASATPSLVMPCSLPALYFFDANKDGRIERDEFVNLIRFCEQEKQRAMENSRRDREFRNVITRASAAGIVDSSASCRTAFRRFTSYSNVRTVFHRRQENPGIEAEDTEPSRSTLVAEGGCPEASQGSEPRYRVAESSDSDTDSSSDSVTQDGHGNLPAGNTGCDVGDRDISVAAGTGASAAEESSGSRRLAVSHPDSIGDSSESQSDGDSTGSETGENGANGAHSRGNVVARSPNSNGMGHQAVRRDHDRDSSSSESISSDSERGALNATVEDESSPESISRQEHAGFEAESSEAASHQSGQALSEASHRNPLYDSAERNPEDARTPAGLFSFRTQAHGTSSESRTPVERLELMEPLDAGSSSALNVAVMEGIALANIHKLADYLQKEGARKEFMQWLWRLVDFNACGIVTIEELNVFLQALGDDGIDLEELAFYKEARVPLVECIINEFDTTHTGVLEQGDFLVLADLVTREYEYWENRHLDTIGNYELGRTIGRGSSGVVRLGAHVSTHDKYAVKIIRKGKCADMSCVDREIDALKSARHMHVVDLEEVLESSENVFLVLELCGGGSLSDVLRLYPELRMPERTARYYVRQVFSALAFCHAKGICHRDVRLDNVLLDNKGVVKISDFGHSKMFPPGIGWDIHSTMLVGSVHNLSPEQVVGQLYSGEKIDIWSAGVALYDLLVGHPPFYDQDTVKLLENISNGLYEIPPDVSEEAADLIRCMIRVVPEERVALSHLLNHPWFNAGASYGPDMDIYTIPVDLFYSRRPDLAEMIMAGTIHDSNLHFHLADALNPLSSPEDLRGQDWSLKCMSPQMDIRFSVSLFTKPPIVKEPSTTTELDTSGLRRNVSDIADLRAATVAVNRLPSTDVNPLDAEGAVRPSVDPDSLSLPEQLSTRRDSTLDGAQHVHNSDHSDAQSESCRSVAHTRRTRSLDGDDVSITSVESHDVRMLHPQVVGAPDMEFDAFPYRRALPRERGREIAPDFDSDQQIADAAAAANRAASTSAGRFALQRSKTSDAISALTLQDEGAGEPDVVLNEEAPITQSLAKHPWKGHRPQTSRLRVAMSRQRGSIDLQGYPTASDRAEEDFSVGEVTRGSHSLDLPRLKAKFPETESPLAVVPPKPVLEFQPYIEVRLQGGETGLFLRICHKLKTICETKLAEAAESTRQRSAARRPASASIAQFRKTASARVVNESP